MRRRTIGIDWNAKVILKLNRSFKVLVVFHINRTNSLIKQCKSGTSILNNLDQEYNTFRPFMKPRQNNHRSSIHSSCHKAQFILFENPKHKKVKKTNLKGREKYRNIK